MCMDVQKGVITQTDVRWSDVVMIRDGRRMLLRYMQIFGRTASLSRYQLGASVGVYPSLTGAGKGVPVTHDSTHHSFLHHSRAEVFSSMGFNFKRGWRYAAYDKIVFQKWLDGRISAEKAISEIAENNQCDKISVEEFIKCAEELGYARNIGSKEIQTGTETEKTEKSV